MSSLRLSTLTLPTAVLGPENPLPPLRSGADLHADVEVGHGIDEEMRANLRYGHVPSIAPYLLQDDYGRERVPTGHPVAILENEHLRATFLLNAGGRLWSLWHEGTGRELLYSNAVVQPGNLALRDAWFAGGVEWNLGTIGHTPLTCAPLHAARVDLPDGTPVLRMWELERVREVVYQLDAWLPDDATRLVVAVRITNPHDHDVPMYWWSNMAVPESEDVRVVAPADAAWTFAYGSSVDHVPMPVLDGVDRSYSARSTSAADYFFDLERTPRPWVAALDASGSGLVQSSTRELQGRKLFLWGTGPGGRHWQEWLSPAGGAYLEIQAGLARTQLEHLPMPARAQWSWVEAYGLLEVDPLLVHGRWAAARSAVAAAVQAATPQEWLARLHSEATGLADVAPAEILQHGSGWGALERIRRERAGDRSLDLPGTPFVDGALGDEQAPWVRLLEDGVLPATDVIAPPASYQTTPVWKALLAGSTDWLGLLCLGVAAWQAGELVEAESAWEASLLATPSAWAWRNLAVARQARGDGRGALTAYARAAELAPGVLPLVVERLEALLAAGDPGAVIDLVGSLPPSQRSAPRVGFAELRAAVALRDIPRASALLHDGLELPGLREGARDLEQLWWDYASARLASERGGEVDDAIREEARRVAPLPWELDFRMEEDSQQ
ncbi:DUF5107 domain-containing protein [Lapillicoccus sp.]|uniref:DUF5107 domain-containing protein n=1 Tax=Lapillicoccus sp. TaxID=1909287 RepID=UPI0025E24FD1|nr:DUF5107 domain-containing protein [Lapillicoccus sp.]